MPTVAKRHQPQESWKPLQPIILRDPLLYRLAKDQLILLSAEKNLVIDCAHGMYRTYLFGCPKKQKPLKIDGDVLIDVAEDFKRFNHRRWEIYEKICQVAIFTEVSSLEYEISEVENDAYDRDDVNDWFAFINGHAVPVSYSVQVIIQALQDMKPRIRLLAATSLGYLVRHRDHRCYSKSENDALYGARQVLEAVSTRLNDKKLVEVYLDKLKRKSFI